MIPFMAPMMMGQGGGAPWTPLQLGSALSAWWDAGDPSTLTLSGVNVSQWRDKVSGRIASPGNGAPTYSATGRNGKPGLRFAGSGPNLTFSIASGIPTGSSALTAAVAAYSEGGGDRCALNWGSASGGGSWVRLAQDGPLFDLYSEAGKVVGGRTWPGSDIFGVYTAQQNQQIGYADGAQFGSKGDPYSVGTAAGYIGDDVRTGLYWYGTIQQVVICSRVLTLIERQKLEGWESWIDGKAGANLPAGHPYKSAPPTV